MGKTMRKWILFICLALLLVMPVHGEEAKEIHTPEELAAMAVDPAGHYVLAVDLDMEGIAWECFDFSGTLDGAGHSILNLTVTAIGGETGVSYDGNQIPYDTNFAGLFATIENARIENLNLVNFRALVESDTPCFLGGFAGCSKDSTVSRCSISGTLELRAHDRMFGVAGAVGYGTGAVEGCMVDVTLICTDTDDQTKDEQFLGGVFATGFMTADDNTVALDGYVSEHGYVHNGGVTGMLMQQPLGAGKQVTVNRNAVTGKITFFEHNPDRRAYCEAIIGELLAYSYSRLDNTADFQRDERWAYDRELRPEMCESSVYEETVVPAGCDTYGYTEYRCTGCGYTYRDHYTLFSHTVTEWKEAKPATTEAEGERVGYCDGCGKEFREAVPMLEPEPTEIETVAVTEPQPETEAPQAELPGAAIWILVGMVLTMAVLALLPRRK